MSAALLDIVGVSKSFPGVQALERVTFSLRAGEIHAVIGENGAGKSTLMKVLAGIYTKDSGTVALEGLPIHTRTPAEALRLGISTVHQEISLPPNLTVAENIFAGREPTRLNLIRWRELNQKASELLRPFGVRINPRAQVGSLSLAMRQIVEIARALSHGPKVLMLDEPTSSLEAHEVERLLGILRGLAAGGIGILYITHKLEEVFQIAGRVTILRDGRQVATKAITETSIDEVVRLLVGRELGPSYPAKSKARGNELLRVENLTRKGRFRNISFALHQGEILGLAGLVGAGRSEIAQTLFGLGSADTGRVWLRGRELKIRSPAQAVRHGFAYLPEDRKAAGLFPQMSLEENLFSAGLARYARHGLLSRKRSSASARKWLQCLNIRTPSLDQPMALLSGGNQQKALIARWLDIKPVVFIADEPTRGVNVGAKVEINSLLRRLCSEGIGVVVISSELPEILGLCDRILVLHDGFLAGELAGSDATEESIMRLATGQSSVPAENQPA